MMDPATPPRDEPGRPAPQPTVRVISVGRSDIERRLRGERGVELVRVRDGLEAIGELGEPKTRADQVAVVIGRQGVDPGELDRFGDAVRRLEPGATIAAFEDAGLEGSGLRIVSGPEGLVGRGEGEAPAAPARGEPTVTVSTAGVLRALLAGDDLPRVVLADLARRFGEGRVSYVDRESGRSRPSGDGGRAVMDVAHRGTCFGWLIGPASASEALRRAADELALAVAAQRQQEALRASAFTDPLTGAWNRRYFERFMRRALAEARDRRQDLTLLLFDIDDFKRYNDEYGHAAGDEILMETVRLIRAGTRPTDAICRIGGDEFAVVFYEPKGPREPGSQAPRSILTIARRFQEQICQRRFPKLGREAHGSLSISGGLATFPWDGHDLVSLMDHADRLLRQSKAEGKNVIRLGPGARRAYLEGGGDPSALGDAPDPRSSGS
jgi:two-component system cell cycle response regulator